MIVIFAEIFIIVIVLILCRVVGVDGRPGEVVDQDGESGEVGVAGKEVREALVARPFMMSRSWMVEF